jgi:hypothetical protein
MSLAVNKKNYQLAFICLAAITIALIAVVIITNSHHKVDNDNLDVNLKHFNSVNKISY